MTDDTGFAPNPFHGFLTLANCKPQLRKTIGIHNKINTWIAGFSSETLNHDLVGEERLVYLMKVTDIIKYETYWKDSRYKSKIPDLKSKLRQDKAGDNIYKPLVSNAYYQNEFEQIENKNHDKSNKEKDLKGQFVLISKEFYYFGSPPIKISSKYRPKVPIGPTPYGCLTEDASDFISFIRNNYNRGIISYPHKWKSRSIYHKSSCN